jgi:hypothetical protein
MFFTSLGNPYLNSVVRDFLPSLDVMSKNEISMLAKDRSLLSTEAYNVDVVLPWQKKLNTEISFDDVLNELAVRSIWGGDFPVSIPVFTRSGWKGKHVTSPNISSPVQHRLAKFSVDDRYVSYTRLTKNITNWNVKVPRHVRKLTRSTEKLPNIYNRTID